MIRFFDRQWPDGTMLGIHDLRLFIVSGLVLSITPEPDTAHIVGRSAQFGWRSGAAATLGIGSGCLVRVVACWARSSDSTARCGAWVSPPFQRGRRAGSGNPAARCAGSTARSAECSSISASGWRCCRRARICTHEYLVLGFEISRNRIAHPGRFA